MEVLADPEFADLPRDLDVVELWSGVGNIVAAALKRNMKAVPFDKNRKPLDTVISEDILCPAPSTSFVCPFRHPCQFNALRTQMRHGQVPS